MSSKLYDVECHFIESVFNRTSFSRTPLLNRNVHVGNFELYEFSPYPCSNMSKLELNYWLSISSIAVRRQALSRKVCAGGLFSIRWNDVFLYTILAKWRSGKWCFGKMTFGSTKIRKNDVRVNDDSGKWRSVEQRFEKMTIRSNDFRRFFFGKATIRKNCISAKRRFDEMAFRKNDVVPSILTKKS